MSCAKRPENLVFTAGKWGSGGEYKRENPLVQRHAHDRQVSPQWIDRHIAGQLKSITHHGVGDWRLVSLRSAEGLRVGGRAWPTRGVISPPVPPPPCPVPPLPTRIQTMPDADAWDQPWSDNPRAPHIPTNQYIQEKATLAGSFISTLLYGTPANMFAHLG